MKMTVQCSAVQACREARGTALPFFGRSRRPLWSLCSGGCFKPRARARDAMEWKERLARSVPPSDLGFWVGRRTRETKACMSQRRKLALTSRRTRRTLQTMHEVPWPLSVRRGLPVRTENEPHRF